MPRSTLFFIIGLLIITLALGYNYVARPFEGYFATQQAPLAEETAPPTPSPTPTATAAARARVAALSPAQQAAWLVAIPYDLSATTAAYPTDMATLITERDVQHVTLFGDALDRTAVDAALAAIGGDVAGLRVLVDHEGGSVQRLSGEGFTPLADWETVCGQDTATTAAQLAASATELRAAGVDVVLGPVVVLGPSAILGDRVCAAATETVIDRANLAATAYRTAGILPTFKHFPGIGDVRVDLHDEFATTTVDASKAAVYRGLLESGAPAAVMTSFAGVSNQFDDIPCALSKDCVGELERTFPQALTITDALEMEGAAGTAATSATTSTAAADPASQYIPPLGDRAVDALRAGNDLLLFGPEVSRSELERIFEAVAIAIETDDTAARAAEQAIIKHMLLWEDLRESESG